MSIAPINILRPKPYLLQADWNDGTSYVISLETFRKECPCAYCKGEKIGNKVLSEPIEVKDEPGAFILKDLKAIGNYAITALWENGHDTGIYTWEYFFNIFKKNDIKYNNEKIKFFEGRFKNQSKKIKLDVL